MSGKIVTHSTHMKICDRSVAGHTEQAQRTRSLKQTCHSICPVTRVHD
ncbi:hypothetical protein LSH36_326g04230 [Paralvinella palmiformis]|uniref:Uncharacterized protein n=1 Tax=Paralvinella palmiformis TaxID=53620 RepID=A0AAD9JG29_9ANNE|nr:hypothetical protein LSH36_326g04230 [Paralvinella palmiformis]